MYFNAPAPTAKKVSACVGGGSVGMTVSRLAIGRLPPEKVELCDQHRRHDDQSHDEDHRIGDYFDLEKAYKDGEIKPNGQRWDHRIGT